MKVKKSKTGKGLGRKNSRANKRTSRILALEKAKAATEKAREAETRVNQLLARKPARGQAKTERAIAIAVAASKASWQANTLTDLYVKTREEKIKIMADETAGLAEKLLKISAENGHVVDSKSNCIIPANKAWMIENEEGRMTGFMMAS